MPPANEAASNHTDCPVCGSEAVGVVDSRPIDVHGTSVQRRRKCRVCDHRWRTVELRYDVVQFMIELAGVRGKLAPWQRDLIDRLAEEVVKTKLPDPR